MNVEKMSNKQFVKILIQIYDECQNSKIYDEYLLKTISEELRKPNHLRDYSLIHECYLTLSECFGYQYNKGYEELSEKQIKRVKTHNNIKRIVKNSKLPFFETNIF